MVVRLALKIGSNLHMNNVAGVEGPKAALVSNLGKVYASLRERPDISAESF
jgi:hypothetical protein